MLRKRVVQSICTVGSLLLVSAVFTACGDKGGGGGKSSSGSVHSKAKSAYKKCKKECGVQECDDVGSYGYSGGYGGGGLISMAEYKNQFGYSGYDDRGSTRVEDDYFSDMKRYKDSEDKRIINDMIKEWNARAKDCDRYGSGGGYRRDTYDRYSPYDDYGYGCDPLYDICY